MHFQQGSNNLAWGENYRRKLTYRMQTSAWFQCPSNIFWTVRGQIPLGRYSRWSWDQALKRTVRQLCRVANYTVKQERKGRVRHQTIYFDHFKVEKFWFYVSQDKNNRTKTKSEERCLNWSLSCQGLDSEFHFLNRKCSYLEKRKTRTFLP